MDKPIELRIEDFKRNLVESANNSQLTCTILLPYVKEFFNEVQAGAARELEKARTMYKEEGEAEDE